MRSQTGIFGEFEKGAVEFPCQRNAVYASTTSNSKLPTSRDLPTYSNSYSCLCVTGESKVVLVFSGPNHFFCIESQIYGKQNLYLGESAFIIQLSSKTNQVLPRGI